MEILQLRYFFESAKNENFAKTAEKYMVPTTSVSASVKRLEQELGCKLFDRLSNRIILNENGKRLRQSLCLVFSELDEAVDSLSKAEEDSREIKMLVRAMRSNITDYIIEYKERHPNIAFKTVFDFAETDFEKYDIIIDEKTDAYSEYEKFELCTMRLRMKVKAGSPLSGRRLVLKQLSNQPFISMGEQSNMHKILMRNCNRAGFTPNIVVQSNDINCYDKLVESGIGIGLGRERLNDAADYLDITDFDERYTVYGYYKKHADYGNVRHFLNFLKGKSK
ncbi:MAG: LysR family transcriptional regulator [Clostridia bacterium]|nr:LysR family transcriptional regulator [Clostridia bacterium]